ncbi:ATP-dependent nuclease [Piscinibacter sakaiensis]|uniref:ATP-dependent nuclease n=1 Tax=Piscinibacter sakaiensis TaxID=1547922 RepID=UPI003AAAFB67
MQIRHLKVENFRGAASLDWSPGASFCCLIGAGDSGKSTVLDAVEAALSSRWLFFGEHDFHCGDTAKTISVEATVGELSKALKSDERFGLYIRGWTAAGSLRDEPEGDDEAVLTVRLTVDATLEAVWQVVCDRADEPRTISNRDRAMFGLVRLAGDDARHLAWGQGSVLSRLTGESDEAATRLAAAYKAARDSANLGDIEALSTAATAAEGFAKGLGAYVDGGYGPGLELGRGGLSSGSIALHDAGVPLRLAGLGTRRLATLAIQKSAIAEGAIVLVDEIEHGLEPHRVMGAISQLRGDQKRAAETKRPTGQVLITTHSEVALGEAGADSLRVCRTSRPERETSIVKPGAPDPIRALMRFAPRALFSRRILVSEGNTEVGVLNGAREFWPPLHGGLPIEHRGAFIADGNGSEAPAIALGLRRLGYEVAVYRDSDTALKGDDAAAFAAEGIPVIEYGGGLDVEHAIISVASDAQMQRLLAHLRAERGVGKIDENLMFALGMNAEEVAMDFGVWALLSEHDDAELRRRVAGQCTIRKWMKDQRIARGVGPIAWEAARDNPASPLALTFDAARAWLYA